MADPTKPGSRKCSARNSLNTVRSLSARIPKYNSANSFVNYLTEFLRAPENKGTTSKRLFKLAGMRWQQMSSDEKTPYIDAAMTNKRLLAEQPRKNRYNKKLQYVKSTCSACGHRHGSKIKAGKSPRKVNNRRGGGLLEKKGRAPSLTRTISGSSMSVFDSDTDPSSVSSY